MTYRLTQLLRSSFKQRTRNLSVMIKLWLTNVPCECVVCSLPGKRYNLCSLCIEELPRLQSVCFRCGLPVTLGTLCGPCLLKPPAWHAMTCAVPYIAPFDKLIAALKFRGRTHVAQALTALLIEAIGKQRPKSAFAHLSSQRVPQRPDLIVPVPLHWTRLWARGFNQAELLARPIGKQLNIPVAHALVRIRSTRAQTLIKSAKRKANLRNAFDVRLNVKDLNIALVDDVVTTGATVTSASQALLKAGAKSVHVWACIRAKGPHPTKPARRKTSDNKTRKKN